jgi:hypothetical protein
MTIHYPFMKANVYNRKYFDYAALKLKVCIFRPKIHKIAVPLIFTNFVCWTDNFFCSFSFFLSVHLSLRWAENAIKVKEWTESRLIYD